MLVQLLSIMILCGSCNALLAQNKSCKLLLGELGNEQSKFVYCATYHSVPVALCVGCVTVYKDMITAYEALMSIKNCSDQYLNTDRINIVPTTHGALTNIWQKANCDDCFRGNHSENYEKLWNNLDGCLKLNKKSECTHCQLDYITLNDFYIKMDQDNKGHVCFDLQDSMNRTRSHWSKDLKCCQRQVKLTLYLTSASVVLFLTVVFYGSAVVLTKRREARHGIVNHEAPELNDPAPSTSTLITAAILSTPQERVAEIDARTEKIANLFSSATNDQPLPKSKPTHAYSDDSDDDQPLPILQQMGSDSETSDDERPILKTTS